MSCQIKPMEPRNCWEFWNCKNSEKEKCPACQTSSGKDCFNLTYQFRPIAKKDFQYCWECPWERALKTTFDTGNS